MSFRAAGFREIRWQELVVPDKLLDENDPNYWTTFLEEQPLTLIECIK
jgi:hypothetical protein